MIKTQGRLFAALVALLGFLSLFLQGICTIQEQLGEGGTALGGIWQLLGYFTILTNLWVTFVMARVALNRWPGGQQISTSAISAATLYIGIVSVIYHFVLSSLWHLEGWKKIADTGLHYIVPLFTILFWILYTPKTKITYRSALTWMYYPLAYCFYALIRGTITGWYPYPFLKVTEIGWTQTVINAVALSGMFYVLGLGLVSIIRKLDSSSHA